MKALEKIVLTLFTLPLALLLTCIAKIQQVLRFGFHPGTNYEIRTVPHTAMNPYRGVRFDVAADAQGTLHLAWQGDGEPFYYQASPDQGQTWTEPVMLVPAEEAGRFHVHKDTSWLFSHEQQLVLLWTGSFRGGLRPRMSYDGGRSWIEGAKESVVASSASHYQVLAQEGATLYAVYPSRAGYLFRRSDDFGQSWTAPVKIAAYHGLDHALDITCVALAVHRGKLYSLWAEPVGLPIGLVSHMYLAYSEDGGTTWSAPVEITPYLDIRRNLYILSLTLQVSETGLHVCFYVGNPFYMMLEKNGRSLVPPRRVVRSLSSNPSLLLDEEDILRAAWADQRYTVKTYSFPELFNSPNWANSDVMVSTIREGRRGRARVVTPFLSGIASGPKLCRLPSGEVFLFWGGQKKVGKTRDQFGCPTEIFFARVF